jgi:hypothetical protein
VDRGVANDGDLRGGNAVAGRRYERLLETRLNQMVQKQL